MNDERLAQIRARLDGARPGPWRALPPDTGYIRGTRAVWVDPVVPVLLDRWEDGVFIANAPADVAYLLAALADAEARRSADEARLAALVRWEEVREERIAAQVTWMASHSEEDWWHLSDKTEHEEDMRNLVEKLFDAQRADAARTGRGEG